MQMQKNEAEQSRLIGFNDADQSSLIAFGIPEAMRYNSPSVCAFKSGNHLGGCNRATINNSIDSTELEALHNFYAGVPYAVWLDERNDAAKSKLVEHGFSYTMSRPIMTIDLTTLVSAASNENISVRLVENDDELFNTWIPIIAQAYVPHLKGDGYKNYHEQYTIFLRYLQKTIAPQNLSFYLGFLNDVPVATGMFVRNQGLVGVHWIGTIPEFRNKGMGFAATHAPLHEFKQAGAEKAHLLASPSGYPVYEKMGFKKLFNCEVYTRQQ